MVSVAGFDLRERPWIPVRRGDERFEVGLRELLLRAHDLTDIEVPVAPGASGLWRVLYLIAARVSGLDDGELPVAEFDQARSAVLRQGRFDAAQVDAYFARYADRFDLFGARPWMQDARLASECATTSGLNRLVLGRPAGSNQVWFGHHHDAAPIPIRAAEAAWHLLAALYYGPSGRCTSRTVRGQSEANTLAGPLRSGLSCHPLGRTVFESLVVGIPGPDSDDAFREAGADEAPWEATDPGDPLGVPRPLRGVARQLAGRFQHAVLLVPDAAGEYAVDATLTWAWRHKAPAAQDDYLIYQFTKDARPYPRPADASRALWRDLDALLLKSDDRHLRPQVFAGIRWLPQETRDGLRVRVFGFDQDGQTRDKQFFTQTTPPVLQWLEEQQHDFAVGISAAHDAGELLGRNLGRALRAAWAALGDPGDGPTNSAQRRDAPDGPWVAVAEGRYWPQAEKAFWALLTDAERAGDPASLADAADVFTRIAAAVYDGIAGQIGAQTHVRMVRALARNRYRIYSGVGRRNAA